MLLCKLLLPDVIFHDILLNRPLDLEFHDEYV